MCRSAGVGGSSVDEHRLLGSEVLGAEEVRKSSAELSRAALGGGDGGYGCKGGQGEG